MGLWMFSTIQLVLQEVFIMELSLIEAFVLGAALPLILYAWFWGMDRIGGWLADYIWRMRH